MIPPWGLEFGLDWDAGAGGGGRNIGCVCCRFWCLVICCFRIGGVCGEIGDTSVDIRYVRIKLWSAFFKNKLVFLLLCTVIHSVVCEVSLSLVDFAGPPHHSTWEASSKVSLVSLIWHCGMKGTSTTMHMKVFRMEAFQLLVPESLASRDIRMLAADFEHPTIFAWVVVSVILCCAIFRLGMPTQGNKMRSHPLRRPLFWRGRVGCIPWISRLSICQY